LPTHRAWGTLDGDHRSKEACVQSVRIRSGWVTFAAVVAGIVGVFNLLSGIAAVAEDDQTEALKEVLYGVDISAWGWFWLIVGAVQLVTAWLIYQRSPVGQTLGLIWAFVVGALSVFMIFVAPIWALIVMALSVTVIWALTAFPEEFGESAAPPPAESAVWPAQETPWRDDETPRPPRA
jgi:hypothetical protein